MIIGVPREIMDMENRVAIVPAGVDTLVKAGHEVVVEMNAGAGSNIADADFEDAGAKIVDHAREVFKRAEMIIKVKEPLEPEFDYLQTGQIIYTFLHLAPKPELTDFLCRKKICGIGYETIQLDDGSLPILAPMSEVAGRMSIQVGAHFLEKTNGGEGVLLGGVPGVDHGKVTIIGAGVVGRNAMRVALAMGAEVTMIGINMQRLRDLEERYAGRVKTLVSNEYNIKSEVVESDLVVGAVLLPGSRTPRLVTREMVSRMRRGSVIVDVAIDQGGCVETARVTTHSSPTYEVDGVIHYCVANIPGAVPRTSTFALTNATLPYALEIANKGAERAMRENVPLKRGLNVYGGNIVNRQVADSQDKKWLEVF
ncbi:MAG: alanine dehydrogenase [Desulfobulbaceae bacterium]|nr:alanine dehydrogenase [Desulfobulbaceae bacterium]